jgi:leader peptidase (prepilin peptidase)/N-methyltransferase
MMDARGDRSVDRTRREKPIASLLANLVPRIAIRSIATMVLVISVAVAAIVVSIRLAPGAVGMLGAALAVVVISIAFIDLRHYIIPDGLNVAGFVLAMVHAVLLDREVMLSAAVMAAVRGMAVALLFFAVRQVYHLIRGRTGLGLGDVKLAVVVGAWLDWSTIPVAIEIATVTALSVLLLRQYILGRPIAATSRVPFGFFLAPAIWLGWVLQITWLAPIY